MSSTCGRAFPQQRLDLRLYRVHDRPTIDPGEGLERVVRRDGAVYNLITNDAATRSYLDKWIDRPSSQYVSAIYSVEPRRESFHRIDGGRAEYL